MANDLEQRTTPGVWDGFGTTLVHDIGKVAELTSAVASIKKRQPGWTPSHTKHLKEMVDACFGRFGISGSPHISDLWYGLIKHDFRSMQGTVQIALDLADQISKQIQGERYSKLEGAEILAQDPDAANRLRRDRLPTHFFSYWKEPKLWDARTADEAFAQICQVIADDPTLRALLDLQNPLEDFPHTRYVPHLSLKLHDMFAASLFYFIYRKLREVGDPNEIREFAVYAIEVTPDLLDVFYRLRDILACGRYAKNFYEQAVLHLFTPWEGDLPGLTAEHNPFVFYESQGFVFLYPDFDTARAALQRALGAVPFLRKVEIRCARFGVDLKYSGTHWERGAAKTDTFVESLPAPALAQFVAEGGERCQACQRMVADGELVEDDKGNWQCKACHASRRESSGIDLDLVSRAGNGSDRIAYIFVTLPPDLRTHAAEVAETTLIPEFWLEHHLPPAYQLPATEQHVFEYLQALLAIRQFDAALKERVEVIRRESGQTAALILFQNPSSKAIVTHEDYFWDLVGFVHAQKQNLHLECSVRAVLCAPKTPFWSLVELATQHRKGDFLWDVSREAIHMFSDKEIENIRKLAEECKKNRIWRSQLMSLSGVALQTSLQELLLEADQRADRLKEVRQPLKQALSLLENAENELRTREKRAVFLKYIAGLTR